LHSITLIDVVLLPFLCGLHAEALLLLLTSGVSLFLEIKHGCDFAGRRFFDSGYGKLEYFPPAKVRLSKTEHDAG